VDETLVYVSGFQLEGESAKRILGFKGRALGVRIASPHADQGISLPLVDRQEARGLRGICLGAVRAFVQAVRSPPLPGMDSRARVA